LAEENDSATVAARKRRQKPPGFMSFYVAMKHVQEVLQVREREAHRLLEEAKNEGRIRYDMLYRSPEPPKFGSWIRFCGSGPPLLAADVLYEFPPKQPEKRPGRKPHPSRDAAISMAVAKLDQEGSRRIGEVAQWIHEWLAQRGDSAANSTVQGWAGLALAEHERARRSLYG
jgi:hypothetical protein